MTLARRRVLVADDDQDLRTVIGKFLRAEGLEVITAENGLEALEQIDKNRPDLAILDYMMPGKTGLEVLAEIRSRKDLVELPIILLTAVTHRTVRVGSLESGANDYLAKPFDPPELIARARRLLRVLEAEDMLRAERARQSQRLELLLQGAALLAGGASEHELYSELDWDLANHLDMRLSAVFIREEGKGNLVQVFPQGHPLAASDANSLASAAIAHWGQEGPEAEFQPPASLRPMELWFPIRASGQLQGAVGYRSRGGQLSDPQGDPGLWPTLSALSRLLGLASENRALMKREQQRLAQETEMQSAIFAQERVLPDRLPVLSDLDAAAVTIPARATGGDYFSFFRYKDGTDGAFLADVVGKGLTAAMHTMVLNTLVREHGPLCSGPRELLESINRVLHDSLDWVREDPIPCTAVRLGTVATPLEIECANSGHEVPLLVEADGSAVFLRSARSFPLGWKAEPAIAMMRVQLRKDDALLFYSDGLLDLAARQDGRGSRPGAEALSEWFELRESRLSALAVRRVVEKVLAGPVIPDDVTILMVRGGTVLTPDGIATFPIPGGVEMFLRSAPGALKTVRDAAAEFLEKMDVAAPDVYAILAALTEIHTNAIVHGMHGLVNQPLRISMTRREDGLEFEVEEFHCGSVRPPALPKYPYIRGDGGMGLVLTRKVMSRLDYITTDRISLRARMQWSGPGKAINPP